MIACILLSAGLSQRFGSPKALAKLDGQTVIEHLQKTLIDSFVDEVCVVLGASAEQIEPYLLKHTKVKVVYNKDYNFGQTSSFKVGLNTLSSDVKGVMLLPVDLPGVKLATVNLMINAFRKNSSFIHIPTYNKIKGHPPIFPIHFKEEILALSNSTGINTIIKLESNKIVYVETGDAGVIKGFNTPEELHIFKSEMGFI